MSANPIWIAGYFGPVAGAAPVWIAPGDGTVPSAVQSEIVSYYAPVAGATAVWIAGFFAPPPAAIGATPITISGWGGSGGGGSPPVTSVWSASDAAANGMTLSNGGLTVTNTTPAVQWPSVRNTISKTSGKVYTEFHCNAIGNNTLVAVGLGSAGFVPTGQLGSSSYSVGIFYNNWNNSAGFTVNYEFAHWVLAGDVFGLAVDFATGSMWIAINGVWTNGNDPAAGLLPMVSFVPATVGALFAGLSLHDAGDQWTLQATAASQKYAPPSGFSAWDSAAPTHSPQALAYLARTVGGNEGGNGANIATLIDGLVSDGVWAKLDALYVLAQQNQTDAKLNLIGTSYTASGSTLRIAPTFTQYAGFSFPGGSSLNLNFTPSTATSPNYTLNSASYGLWSYAVLSETVVQMGANVSSLYNDYGGNTFYGSVNNTGIVAVTTTITKGLFAVDRAGAATWYQYQNGAAGSASTSAPTSVDTTPFILAQSGSLQTLSAAFIGASLGAAGQLALYNRLRTYMSSVGVP